MKKIISIIALIAALVFQLTILVSMPLTSYMRTMGSEEIKLRCEPVDPYDPLQGRYVQLTFSDSRIEIEDLKSFPENLESGERVYALLSKKGKFHIISELTREKPSSDQLFFTVLIRNVYAQRIDLKFPFDRYYMQENDALRTESLLVGVDYSKTDVYLVLSLKNGKAIQKGLFIDNVPIEEAIYN